MSTNKVNGHVRPSVRSLQDEYEKGNKQPLEDLLRAWKGIKDLPPCDPQSFFVLGGYHGEPFVYRQDWPEGKGLYWGGYCNHGNVLFPTWHRIYVLKLEQALQSIVPGVMMPYWDETSQETLAKGIPWILTAATVILDEQEIDNPLRSFVLPETLSDNMAEDKDYIYAKPKGYETVRYPLSGLVGTPQAQAKTERHNAQYPDPDTNSKLLNNNVLAWLKGNSPTTKDPNPSQNGIQAQYQMCLQAPNYTAFSNTTSAQAWNKENPGTVVPLESPHNDIHLSVGGFDVPGSESGQIADTNGDMGENNTAALDPIFFFHHCNVDRMFWLWQQQNGCTNNIDIISGYAGTNSNDLQGPTPGVPPDTTLDLDTPLNPFRKDDGTPYTSKDCVNIATQLGYTYGPGSLKETSASLAVATGFSTKKLTVRGIDRALFQGSFVITAYATVGTNSGETTEYYLGYHSVLSRRDVVRCVNCLTHLEVIAHFPLSSLPEDRVEQAEYRIDIQHRGPNLPTDLSYTFEVSD